jgi:hypothetical protein
MTESEESEEYECDDCDASFETEDALGIHRTAVHDREESQKP